jgi:hypothetical protein
MPGLGIVMTPLRLDGVAGAIVVVHSTGKRSHVRNKDDSTRESSDLVRVGRSAVRNS